MHNKKEQIWKSPADLVHKDTILVDMCWLGSWHSKGKSPETRGHTDTIRVISYWAAANMLPTTSS